MRSRNSFLDEANLPDSQRRKVEERRREQGFRGSGSSGDPIRRETAQERQTRQSQTNLLNLQKELSATGTILTQSEQQAILEGKSAAEVRSQIVQRQRKEDLGNLQKELSGTGTRLTESQTAAILRGDSISSIRDNVFSQVERKRLDNQRIQERLEAERSLSARESQNVSVQKTPADSQSKRSINVISELPPSASLSERVRRFSREQEILRTGAGATGAGLLSGFIAIGEGVIDTIKNPVAAARSVRDSAVEFARGGNPLPEIDLMNPERGGDFAFGRLGAEGIALAASPSAIGAIRRRTSSPSVQSVSRGQTTSVVADQGTATSGSIQTLSVANNKRFFVTDTSIRSADIASDVSSTVRITGAESSIQRLNRRGSPRGSPTDSRSLSVEQIADDASTSRQRVVGETVQEVDGKIIRQRTAGAAQQVTEDFTIAGVATGDSTRISQLSAQASRDVVKGEIPVVQRIDGVTIETLRQGRVSEVRATTLTGKSVDRVLNELGREIKFVDQARGNVPRGSDRSTSTQQQRTTDSSAPVAQINEQINEAVKSLVVDQQARSAATVSAPISTAANLLPSQKDVSVVEAQSQETNVVSAPSQPVTITEERAVSPSRRTSSLSASIVQDNDLSSSIVGASRSKSIIDSDNALDVSSSASTDILPVQDVVPAQRSRQLVTPINILQGARGAFQSSVMTRNIPRTKIPLVPTLSNKLNIPSTSPLFKVIVGREGNLVYKDLGTGGFDLIEKAKRKVQNTAAATVQIIPVRGSVPKSELKSILGDTFSKSKSLDDAFVEDKEERISTAGELRDITFAPRKKTREGITATKDKTNTALKLIGEGNSLRKIRGLLK